MFLLTLALVIGHCGNKSTTAVPPSLFADTPVARAIVPGIIDEASGIADSKRIPGYLWVEEDSNNPNFLYLLGHDGKHGKKMFLKGLNNRDWEDLVLSKGPEAGANYLYLADIGDNYLQHAAYVIYRFKEPALATDTVSEFEKIRFKYPDGSHNAEAILVDETSHDIFVFTKTETTSKIYKIAYPQSLIDTTTATLEGELPFPQVVSAAASPGMNELIVKTYTSLNYFSRQVGEKIPESLKRQPVALKYQWELQGEAICFKNDNSGFFTLSERPSVTAGVSLNFYKRK